MAAAQAEPRGSVRFACPTGLVDLVSQAMPDFLTRFPRVNVRIIATDRAVDLIAERIDVAMRVRVTLESDAALTMRTLARSRRILIASPALANTIADPQDIAGYRRISPGSSACRPSVRTMRRDR